VSAAENSTSEKSVSEDSAAESSAAESSAAESSAAEDSAAEDRVFEDRTFEDSAFEDSAVESSASPLRGLIVDWGGVLTAPIDEAMTAWARHEGIDLENYRTVMRGWIEGASPIHGLERGELTTVEFERLLADRFREHGVAVEADGLLARMLDGLRELSDDMVNLVRRARRQGLKTALLSNSWGEHYPEHLWVGAFDAVVISGRVGMRKPDEEIFRHTADLLQLPAAACVMVDDLAANIRGAVAAGMVGVLHVSYQQTLDELEILFDLPLR
jgi:epoxide hydrolase-like predicted phosphatase